MSFFNIYTCRIYHNIFCIFYEYFNDWYFLLLRGEYIFGTNFVRAVYHTSTCVHGNRVIRELF